MSIQNLQEIKEIKNLPFLAKQVVEGMIVGLHKSPFHGYSAEFAEHKVYNQGESTRNIDWKVYARTEKLYTKKFDEETNLRCQIVIDTSSSMYYPQENAAVNKIKFSALCAAALIELLKKQRDAIGLSLFAENVNVHTKTKSNTLHTNMLFNYLENALQDNSLNKTSSTTAAIHEIAEQIHKRSLVIIFSDMMQQGNVDELFDALQHLKHNKHEVVLFHVADKKTELDFEFENRPYQFVDMETGAEVKLHANQVKEAYVSEMKKFEDSLRLKCTQNRIDFVAADIRQNFNQILTPYLLKRTKLL